MAIYTITTANWNDPQFWSSVNESASGYTMDFNALHSNFNVTTSLGDFVKITDGATTFTGRQSSVFGTDTNFAGCVLLDYFANLIGRQGNDNLPATVTIRSSASPVHKLSMAARDDVAFDLTMGGPGGKTSAARIAATPNVH